MMKIPRNAAVLSVDIVGHEALKKRVRKLEERVQGMCDTWEEERAMARRAEDASVLQRGGNSCGSLDRRSTEWNAVTVAVLVLCALVVVSAAGAGLRLPLVRIWTS